MVGADDVELTEADGIGDWAGCLGPRATDTATDDFDTVRHNGRKCSTTYS